MRIVVIRIAGSQPEDNMWGFGQTLAVILSVVPLWGLYERIYGILILRDLMNEVKLTAIKIPKSGDCIKQSYPFRRQTQPSAPLLVIPMSLGLNGFDK